MYDRIVKVDGELLQGWDVGFNTDLGFQLGMAGMQSCNADDSAWDILIPWPTGIIWDDWLNMIFGMDWVIPCPSLPPAWKNPPETMADIGDESGYHLERLDMRGMGLLDTSPLES